jgi:hypothetical protein
LIGSVHHKKALIAVAIVITTLAIVIPAARMVNCEMSMGGAMPFGRSVLPGFFSTCGGTLVVSSAPNAVMPAGADAFTLALVASALAMLVLYQPPLVGRTVRVRATEPPPPPEDPLGERFRV